MWCFLQFLLGFKYKRGILIKSELTGTQNVLNLITDVIYPNSGYIDTSGVVHTNDNFWYSDLITVNELQKSVSIYWHNAVATFTFYDSNGDYKITGSESTN